MRVSAQVRPGFLFPWAGAFLALSPDFSKERDLSAFDGLEFMVRGTPGTYRAMLFGASAGIPPTAEFSITPEWTAVRLPLSAFRNLNPLSVTGLALVAGPGVGEYDFDVDSVKLTRP